MPQDDHETPQGSSDAGSGSSEIPKEDKTVMGMPLDVFVRGGTTSYRHDMAEAELTADAERRRATQDAERRLASIPIEQNGAMLHGGPLVPKAGEPAYVDLYYLNAAGEQRYEFGEAVRCLADVVLIGPQELCVILVCVACKERGVPLDRCQMRVRQSNRKFELSSKGAGEPIPWVEGHDKSGRPLVKMYRAAGTIVESEKFSCAQCGWSARIENNRVRPER